jgi:hypothetical protein
MYIYRETNTTVEIVGSLYSEYSREIQNFVLYFRPNRSVEFGVWNDSIGDWGD